MQQQLLEPFFSCFNFCCCTACYFWWLLLYQNKSQLFEILVVGSGNSRSFFHPMVFKYRACETPIEYLSQKYIFPQLLSKKNLETFLPYFSPKIIYFISQDFREILVFCHSKLNEMWCLNCSKMLLLDMLDDWCTSAAPATLLFPQQIFRKFTANNK